MIMIMNDDNDSDNDEKQTFSIIIHNSSYFDAISPYYIEIILKL